MGGDHEKFSDDSSEWLIWLNEALHKMLPIVLIILIGYLFVSFFTDFYHPILTLLERFVIGYFIIELVVAFILYNSKKQFVKDKWFHILLILPVFAALRVVGRVFQVFRGGAAMFEGLRALQLLEASQLSRIFGGYRIARVTAYLAEVQKGLHAIVDIPKALGRRKMNWFIGTTGITFLEKWIPEKHDEHGDHDHDEHGGDDGETSEDKEEESGEGEGGTISR